MNYQKVSYKLINNDTKTSIALVTDPKEWDNSERTSKREKTYGVIIELSKNLVFTKEGADFLKLAYDLKDIEADVTLEEYRVHPNTEIPYLHSTGSLNFSKYKASKLEVKVPFLSGGLNALIKSQEREKFELERLEAINGNVINAVEKQNVALTSRNILLVSKLETHNDDAISTAFRMNFTGGNTRTGSLGIPVRVTVDSDEKASDVINNYSFTTTPNTGEVASMFYFNNDVQKDIKVNIKGSFKIKEVKVDDLIFPFMKVDLVTFENGASPTLLSRETLYEVPNIDRANNLLVNFSYAGTIRLEPAQSLSLQWYGGGIFGSGGIIPDDGDLKVDFEDIECVIDLVEDSIRDNTQTKAIFLKDIGDKLMQIITGEQGRFHSDFLTNGDFSKAALTTGMWIREFYTKTEIIDDVEVEVEQTMSISLDQFLKTCNAVFNTAHHIEIINGVETLVVEDLKYYFKDTVAISLPNQVTNLDREADSKLCHSSLEFGYKKGGEYEEAMGLDEYNVKTGFTTPLERVTTKYSKLSDARADAYGKEFARRKPKINFPTTDTSYDKDLFLLDLKTGFGEYLEERIYSDDFETLPKGVYDPISATNLRLTPSQIEQRHEWFYGCGLLKEQDEKIRYSNTEGNNSLTTKKVGETARSEKDDILISTLEKARFAPKKITFEHPVDYFINEQLNGKTNVNGRLIPNVYFKVEFINEYNKLEYGYLMSIKPNGSGKWELLKAL